MSKKLKSAIILITILALLITILTDLLILLCFYPMLGVSYRLCLGLPLKEWLVIYKWMVRGLEVLAIITLALHFKKIKSYIKKGFKKQEPGTEEHDF